MSEAGESESPIHQWALETLRETLDVHPVHKELGAVFGQAGQGLRFHPQLCELLPAVRHHVKGPARLATAALSLRVIGRFELAPLF